MAWIELRRRRYVVIDRVEGVKAKGPSYDTRADAEAFLELVALAGWPAAVAGYPAAVTVPLAFATMVAVSRLTRSTIPTDVARVFARMHLPERLGMGIERLPRG